MQIFIFYQSLKHQIADLHWCLGNAYRLENDFVNPPVFFEKALKMYKSLRNVLKQVKVYVELGKAYR